MKVPFMIVLNFALAILVTFSIGSAAGVVVAAATAGWLYVWRRGLLTPHTVFRVLIAQCSTLSILAIYLRHWPK